jgi:hypothetical protein
LRRRGNAKGRPRARDRPMGEAKLRRWLPEWRQ